MGPSDAIQLVILIILLSLSAFFSSAETALTTVNRLRIRALVDDGDARATILWKVIDDPGKLLSAILIGNNIVNISASSIATVLATNFFGSAGAVDKVLGKFEEEIGELKTVVSTGGMADVIAPYCTHKIISDEKLLFKGLNIIYKKN